MRQTTTSLFSCVLLAFALSAPVAAAKGGSTGLLLPFVSGQQVTILNGYNNPPPGACSIGGGGNDHCGHQQYAFDFWPASSGWIDDLILSPVTGTVMYYDISPAAGPCLGIRVDGISQYNLTLCHFDVKRPGLEIGDSVEPGDILGVRGSNWVHMSIDDRYRFDRSRNAVEFSGRFALEGVEYRAAVPLVVNQYANVLMTSSNATSATPSCKTYDQDLVSCDANSTLNPSRLDLTQDCAFYTGSFCPDTCRPRGTGDHLAGCQGPNIPTVAQACSTWDGDLAGCDDHSIYNPDRPDLSQDCAFYGGPYCPGTCRPRGTPNTQAGCSQ